MKYSNFYIPTLREAPSDAVIPSHLLMLRAGMIRKLANGLFAYLPLGLRSFRKLEKIIREEMDAINSLEIKPTVVVPGEFWKESGRWDAMGEALLRVKNRTGADFVVSPTAEEAVTALVREDLTSYRQLPLSVYQINTKYRDEIRPRYGVMRGREFVMHDAYSFHLDDGSLDRTYQDMGRAYTRIFRRCGLSVLRVRADSGAMGGSGSEEFMVESGVGDNTLLICPSCAYSANVEKAACKNDFPPPAGGEEARKRAEGLPAIEKIETPAVKTIAELCAFLKTDAKSFIKTLIYKEAAGGAGAGAADGGKANGEGATDGGDRAKFYAVCIRGDLEVNEVKLANLLNTGEPVLASDNEVEQVTGAPVGFAGPVGMTGVTIVADESALSVESAITGALERDRHYKNVAYWRDWTAAVTGDIRTVKAGDGCPLCGAALYEKKGNELGHIFKLGKKYTEAMNVRVPDEAGTPRTPVMGCYGIGLDRTLASVIEEGHDEAGIIWPATVAPFHVIIVPVRYDGAVKAAADSLEAALEAAGVEALLDDRPERAGVKFNDADLIGIPYRVVIGEKNLGASPPEVEIKRRGGKEAGLTELSKAALYLKEKIRAELAVLNGE